MKIKKKSIIISNTMFINEEIKHWFYIQYILRSFYFILFYFILFFF